MSKEAVCGGRSEDAPQHIRIEDYNYTLPDERIAKYPLTPRDASKLLLYRHGTICAHPFRSLSAHLPPHALLLFNNTRVIRARLLFQKETGANIEIFCLEPHTPHDYAQMFATHHTCQWTCMIGNLKRWKSGALQRTVQIAEKEIVLTAERVSSSEQAHVVRFSWNQPEYSFSEVLEASGVLPIPPYLHRETVSSDLQTYQTVYSKTKGSVAAPTAGLHFTPDLLRDLAH